MSMATTTSCRIAILTTDIGVHIETFMPSNLSGNMSSSEWESFRNNVDDVLKSLTELKKKVACKIKYFLIFFAGIILLNLLTFLLVKIKHEKIVSFLLILAMSVYGTVDMVCYSEKVRMKEEKIVEDLERVLTEEGRKLSNVSFHLNHELGDPTKPSDSIEYTVVSMTGVPIDGNEEQFTINPVSSPIPFLNVTLDDDSIEVNAPEAEYGWCEEAARTGKYYQARDLGG